MNLSSFVLVGALASFTSVAVADQLNVFIDGFGDPTAFDITEGQHLDLRFSKLVPATGTNTSTHILVEGLSPLEEGTSVYASTYAGIDVATGMTQDTGVLYLNMPPGSEPPVGTVASPIVGVVQRPGDWDAYIPSFPPTDIGTPTGPGDYDGTSLSLTLTDGGSTFLGSADYTVNDDQTLTLAPFTLTRDGGTSYNMAETVLFRDGDRFYGTLTNLSLNADYNSLIFSIELNSIPDLDGDGIPDIADVDISGGLIVGEWNNTEIGYVWGGTPSIGYSHHLGWIYVSAYPAIYNFDFGWMLVAVTPTAPDTAYWMYSPTIGWIFTHSNWGGVFFYDSTGWQEDNFMFPNP